MALEILRQFHLELDHGSMLPLKLKVRDNRRLAEPCRPWLPEGGDFGWPLVKTQVS